MPYDFKKEEKQFYKPGKKPELIEVPAMNFICVEGKGDPNKADSDYKKAIELLYKVAYTIKMSKKGSYKIPNYFDFVVPPLEGFWWQDSECGIDYGHKEKFQFIACIRMPDFVNQEVVNWAIEQAKEKVDLDFSRLKFKQIKEGKCVQIMHIGSYDDEPATIVKMQELVKDQGFEFNYSQTRRHHEIYLSDPRRVKVENLKTIIRLPIK